MTRKELEDCLTNYFARQSDRWDIHRPKWIISRTCLQNDIIYTLYHFTFTIRIFPYKGNWIVNLENDYITCKTVYDVIKTIEEVWRL